jgi:DNA-binding CsgD family transcriptional regulator
MSPQTYPVVVVSPSKLVRELLGGLLQARGVRRLAACATLRESLELAASAVLLVCDATALSSIDFQNYRGALRRQNPALRVVRLDESSGAAAIATLLQPLPPIARAERPPHEALTPLESEVMLGVAAGLRNAEIARRMRRSGKTVEKHRANALRKLGVRNVAQLTAYALRHRLLDGDALLTLTPE